MASHDRSLRLYADIVTGFPGRTIELNRPALYSDTIKPIMDKVLVLLALIPACVIMALVVPFIMLDGGPAFYRQARVGQNGRGFNIFKLRSMVPNADAILEAYLETNAEARAEWNRSQKLKFDPRITWIGRIIRKSSIDELPQLFNVLRGDMALVGPRPMMPEQRKLYPGVAYYALRPGITGFWQTSERNESSFAERANFDTSYFNQVSFWTDVRVMFKTVGVVIAGTGY